MKGGGRKIIQVEMKGLDFGFLLLPKVVEKKEKKERRID